MNQSLDVSTIVFAALAIFIVWKLRSVLGTRTGEERPPFNPFTRRQRNGTSPPPGETGKVIPLPGAATPRTAAAPEADPNRWRGVVASDATAVARQLDAIVAADASFDGKSFLQGARAAYEMIVAAFAKGDRTELKALLSADVFDGFSKAIAGRQARGETIEHTFVALDKALIEDASLREQTAHITVLFESQQINALRKSDGSLVEAGADTVGHVVDHWTFARDVDARDPNWRLVATEAA